MPWMRIAAPGFLEPALVASACLGKLCAGESIQQAQAEVVGKDMLGPAYSMPAARHLHADAKGELAAGVQQGGQDAFKTGKPGIAPNQNAGVTPGIENCPVHPMCSSGADIGLTRHLKSAGDGSAASGETMAAGASIFNLLQ